MESFLIRRFVYAGIILFMLVSLVFGLVRLTSGSPIDRIAGTRATPEMRQKMIARYGLDKPIYTQYWIYLTNLFHGDLGSSILNRQEVIDLIRQKIPFTLRLGLSAFILAYTIGVPLGLLSATRHLSKVDTSIVMLSLAGMSLPDFFLAFVLVYFLALRVEIFPATGYGSLRAFILPVVSLSLPQLAVIVRVTRSSMLQVLHKPYINAARAKGLNEKRVILRHALRNSLLPLLSLSGLYLGYIVSGAVTIELVFARIGVGKFLLDSILAHDYPAIQGIMIILGASVILANLVVDVLYSIVDPRIKQS
jgi:ABC-type dipeptide/oligopeptide/nickel transport system permease component